jgi:DNA-binding phage protein
MADDDPLAQKLLTILPHLNEKQRRLVLAAEARSLGYGGVSQVARATGISRPTIHQGLRELDTNEELKPGIRRAGGGVNEPKK